MDVTEPKLVWVEGRCYRFFESDAWSEKDHASTPYVEDSKPDEFCELSEEVCPVDIHITPIDGGKYMHSFYVPSIFFKFLIGTNGVQRKKLEADTKTTINIPRLGQKGDIVITGSSGTAVASARHRIDLLVESSRPKLRPTHFIAVPMINESVAANFVKFKHIVLNETAKDARGICEKIFQKPERMHLTVGMMSLVDDEEVKLAVEALEECEEKIIKPIVQQVGPVRIKVHGLEIMNDDPSRSTVIYGKVSSDGDALQELADKTMDFFVQKGLMKKEREKVKLHLTVMNSRFLFEESATNRQRAEPFDASEILKLHKDFFFGDVMLNTMQLCRRGQKAEDGYYVVASTINLRE